MRGTLARLSEDGNDAVGAAVAAGGEGAAPPAGTRSVGAGA